MKDGPRDPGQDVLKLTATIIIILLFAFSIILTFALIEQKQWWRQTVGDLVETKVVVPNCSSCHFVLHCQMSIIFFKQKTKTVPFKSILVENGKNNCTYPHPQWQEGKYCKAPTWS